jgi:ketosteroid isomerase-like protein
MSQENVEILKAVYAKWAEGDFWTPEVFDEDVDVVWDQGMPDTGIDRGLPAMERAMRGWLSAWDEYRWVADRFIPVDDRVVVLFTSRGRGKGSSVEVEAHWAHIWTFRDGKATRLEGFVNQADAFEAVGLREEVGREESEPSS